MIKLKQDNFSRPNPIWLVSLQEEEIETHKEMPGEHMHRGMTMGRGSKPVVICRPTREASEETSAADTLILDLVDFRTVRKETLLKTHSLVVFCYGSPTKLICSTQTGGTNDIKQHRIYLLNYKFLSSFKSIDIFNWLYLISKTKNSLLMLLILPHLTRWK